MSILTHHRVGDLGSEARTVVETLAGRDLRDEDRVAVVVTGDPEAAPTLSGVTAGPGPADDPDEAALGERRRQAWLRLIEESEAMPLIPHDDGFALDDIDRVLYGGPGGPA